MKMASQATYQDSVKICLLCIAWYASSSGNNVVGKIILSDFPYPMTITMVQLISISLYVIPVLKLWSVPPAAQISSKYWLTMILPLAFGKFFSSVSSHISIWKVPVSFAHTVKATMPLFTVILTRVIFGERQTNKVYLSLVPIIGGVVVATVTEISFNFIGFMSAIIATIGFALQNIFSKKCLKDTGIHHLRLLATLAQISTICFLPLWFWYDVGRISDDSSLMHSSHTPRLVALLVIDGFCSFTQNLIAFNVIALVTPLSYAVANATKRICVITISLLTLKNPVTIVNLFGMFIAIFGVLLYNKARYDQNSTTKPILPVTQDYTNRKNANSSQISILLQDNLAQEDHIKYFPAYMNGNISHPASMYSNGNVRNSNVTFTL